MIAGMSVGMHVVLGWMGSVGMNVGDECGG